VNKLMVLAWAVGGGLLGYYAVKHWHVSGGRVV
jgi:hypothetical protein